MGVSLSFSSVEPVAPEVEQIVRAEVGAAWGAQPWVLCEPPHLYPGMGDGVLRGGSKLNLHPWVDEVERARLEVASSPGVECDDVQALLRRLCEWSARFDLTWELSLDGMPLGRIEGGVAAGDVEGALEALAGLAQYLGDEFPREMPVGEPQPRPLAEAQVVGHPLPIPPGRPVLRIWPGPEDGEE